MNVGCVPKKVMWNTASIAEALHDAKDYGFGLEPSAAKFDWSIIKKSRDSYVQRLNVCFMKNAAEAFGARLEYLRSKSSKNGA